MLNGISTAQIRRLLKQRPSGPLWLHIVVVLMGMLLVGMVNHSFATQGGAWSGFFLTLLFAAGYYGISLAMLNARFGEHPPGPAPDRR
ncbi:hypothetical protein [Paracoccus sp. (in: a-proteobacteria)]|uniref:hypothetical protein n=1 Tax=Paracoccus sp. TaxID=267 RepID=UPI003A881B34